MPDGAGSRDWNAHWAEADADVAVPAEVLAANLHLLPASGRALDLACGLGGNALALARHGLITEGWDLAAAAVAALARVAEARRLPLAARCRDVLQAPPGPGQWDVIVCSRFLDRGLCPALAAALKPGGLLFYQTFTRLRPTPGGPRNPAFLLEEGELLQLFSSLRPVVYREEGLLGDTTRGWRGQALLVARS